MDSRPPFESSYAADARSTRCAFTLPEVLIVVGIVAVLASILFPAVGKIRQQARSAVCLGNVRQIGQLHAVYLTQNGGRSFQYVNGVRVWADDLRKLSGKTDELLICPEAIDAASSPFAVGAAHVSWGPGTGTAEAPWLKTNRGSYGMNGWLYQRGPGIEYFFDDRAKSFINPRSAPNPSATPAFADCVWIDGWPMPFNEPPTDLENPLFGGNGTGQMPRFCIDRHRRRINVVFLDGGARSVDLGELWELNWTTDWQARQVDP